MNVAIVLAGGSGTRFGGATPKQYQRLAGRPVYGYVLAAVDESQQYAGIVYCGDPGGAGLELSQTPVHRVAGGKTRNHSLRNALSAVQETFEDCSNVTILEAARPFVTPQALRDHIRLLAEHDAVINSLRITDSLSRSDGGFANRDDFCLVQAPESYRLAVLRKCFSPDSETTTPLHQLSAGARIRFYFDMPINLKITYPGDLELAEFLMTHNGGQRVARVAD